MDNMSFHHSARIEEMYLNEGVKLVYWPSFSPNLNPIEEFFVVLEAVTKQNWQIYKEEAKALILSLNGGLILQVQEYKAP